jgi:hypothetical protein
VSHMLEYRTRVSHLLEYRPRVSYVLEYPAQRGRRCQDWWVALLIRVMHELIRPHSKSRTLLRNIIAKGQASWCQGPLLYHYGINAEVRQGRWGYRCRHSRPLGFKLGGPRIPFRNDICRLCGGAAQGKLFLIHPSPLRDLPWRSQYPLLSRPWQKESLIGIISLAQVCLRGRYKYTPRE